MREHEERCRRPSFGSSMSLSPVTNTSALPATAEAAIRPVQRGACQHHSCPGRWLDRARKAEQGGDQEHQDVSAEDRPVIDAPSPAACTRNLVDCLWVSVILIPMRPRETLEAFDVFLAERGLGLDAVVVGGAALNLSLASSSRVGARARQSPRSRPRSHNANSFERRKHGV